MASELLHTNSSETAQNAAAGYAAVILGLVCFVLSLAAIAVIVRFIVGASAGV